MSRRYQKSPIIEALCEFRFTSETWDWTLPGLLYQQISGRFPTKNQVRAMELEVPVEAAKTPARLKGNVERLQFQSADQTSLVQVGPNLLAVNLLAPYGHWEADFKPVILEMLDLYRRVAQPTGFNRIGLRYINRLEIPEPAFTLSDYFVLQPQLPSTMPASFSNLFMRVGLPYEAAHGQLMLTFGNAPDAPENTAAFILDLDFATSQAEQLTFETASAWIESAHQCVEEAFESCITNHARELFEEIKP